jgi:cell division septation protein DedD
MKTVRLLSVLLIAVTMLSSCDFFRSILGKPTSKDIERMKIEAAAQAKKQRQLDSINRAKAEADAIAAQQLESLKTLNDKYYIIIGSFKVEDNATRMYALLEKNGYTPKTIRFKNGFDLVSVASFNDYHKAFAELDQLRALEFCPEDVWIYGVDQKLHEE